MGTGGLALAWEIRIAPANPAQEWRVSGPEGPALRRTQAADAQPAGARAEDSALAAACRTGDLRAYERLYQLHSVRMKSLARNLLGSRQDAEDAVQETFLKVHRSIESFRGQSSFATWVYRILVNSCYDLRRSRLRRQEIAEGDLEPTALPKAAPATANPSLRIALERSLARLTRYQREVLLLYEVEGFAHAEIAAILGVSETASKNTLFQAKKNLRRILTEPGEAAAGAR
jgi:RNA polymerase sigma-70 factor (ECF subfamily)